MFQSLRVVIQFLCLFVVRTECLRSDIMNNMDRSGTREFDYYQKLVQGVRNELSFNTLLVMQRNYIRDQRIQMIYELDVPKMFVSHQETFSYKRRFNSEIMVIVILESGLDVNPLYLLALILHNMRQVRILLIAFNWENTNEFQDLILQACELHKMTNVILHYCNSKEPLDMAYQLLNPYPKYHFESKQLNDNGEQTFPSNWKNMKNKTLFTLPDQVLPGSIIYMNSKGKLTFNGVTARLTMLFAEKFNASLQLLYPVKIGQSMHFLDITNLTTQGLIQLPMTFHPGFSLEDWTRMTYPIVIGKWRIMIPCPQQLPISEVFLALVTTDLLCVIIFTIVVFALIHAAIDFVAVGYVSIWDVILDEKMIRGTLGQSFLLKQHPLQSLTLLYLLIFFLGLNMNVLIGANVKTLITAPPYERGINTVDDLRKSDRKILFDRRVISYRNQEFIESLKDSIAISTNSTYNLRMISSMNSSYGYIVATMAWDLLNRKQIYLNQKNFCIPPGLTIYDLLCFSIMLEVNSPYKEPLNYIIHRVHQAGLLGAWQASAFLDMMTYKRTPINYTPTIVEKRALKLDDLKCVWLTLIGGLTSGFIVFLVEIITSYFIKACL